MRSSLCIFHSTRSSSSSLGCAALHSTTSMHNGTQSTMRNWLRMTQVARYMPSRAQPCGAPLLPVSCRARMRVPMKRIVSIGQKARVPFAFSNVFVMKYHSQPVNSFTVMPTQITMHIMKTREVARSNKTTTLHTTIETAHHS